MQRKYILPLFLIIQIIFLKIIAFFPEFIEQILQQWFVSFCFENFTNYFGENPFFGGRYYVWNLDFISFEIDLEN